jgi:hypothetical protein
VLVYCAKKNLATLEPGVIKYQKWHNATRDARPLFDEFIMRCSLMRVRDRDHSRVPPHMWYEPVAKAAGSTL